MRWGTQVRELGATPPLRHYETLHAPAAPGETGLVVHVFSAEEDSREAAALAQLATTITR